VLPPRKGLRPAPPLRMDLPLHKVLKLRRDWRPEKQRRGSPPRTDFLPRRGLQQEQPRMDFQPRKEQLRHTGSPRRDWRPVQQHRDLLAWRRLQARRRGPPPRYDPQLCPPWRREGPYRTGGCFWRSF